MLACYRLRVPWLLPNSRNSHIGELLWEAGVAFVPMSRQYVESRGLGQPIRDLDSEPIWQYQNSMELKVYMQNLT